MSKEDPMIKVWNWICNLVATIMGIDSDWRQEAVDAGIIDLSGQGKNEYGK